MALLTCMSSLSSRSRMAAFSCPALCGVLATCEQQCRWRRAQGHLAEGMLCLPGLHLCPAGAAGGVPLSNPTGQEPCADLPNGTTCTSCRPGLLKPVGGAHCTRVHFQSLPWYLVVLLFIFFLVKTGTFMWHKNQMRS